MPRILEEKLKKECNRCHLTLDISDFSPRGSLYANGSIRYRGECKQCNALYGREWRKENPEKANLATLKWRTLHPEQVKIMDRENGYKKRFGITVKDFEEILVSQNNKCANIGCGIELTIGKKGDSAHLDHDHKTGKIRAILCSNCNTSLGKLKENPKIILGLLDYINSCR